MLEMAVHALVMLFDPIRLLYLLGGVMFGLVLGIIPGLGGLIGLSILLPFTYGMDPYGALAMMLGLAAVVNTSDAIPAILFSVPGTAGSAATVLDGYPMAQRGQAPRALGASFTASMFGGLFGAVILGVSVPILRPVMMLIGSAELLSICVLGLSLIAALSGGAPSKGLAAAALGILFAAIGEDSQTATLRWTFDSIYLWDGLPIVPVALGLFALPEIADMAIARRNVAARHGDAGRRGQVEGFLDVWKNRWLLLRCSSIGTLLGAIPGIGAPVVDWIAYAHAARTSPGGEKSFGKGDVRGVIASESSTNAKEGGALVPTIAFGVPGSAVMALLLAGFIVHKVVPGPEMLTAKLDLTYTLVWSLALANVLGAALCFLFAGQLGRIALIRSGILVPLIVALVFIGIFQTTKSWGDLIALLLFGVIGWLMKRAEWPRPPVILGFVLGPLVERYMFISVQRFGFEWLTFPIVMVFFGLAILALLRPSLEALVRGRSALASPQPLTFREIRSAPDIVFGFATIAAFIAVLASSWGWQFGAKLLPQAVGWTGLVGALAYVGLSILTGGAAARRADQPGREQRQDSHGEGERLLAGLSLKTMLTRAGMFMGSCLALFFGIAAIGMLPAIFVFLVLYMRMTGGEKWTIAFVIATLTCLCSYLLFHQVFHVFWPHSWLGDMLPALRANNHFNFI